MCCTGSDLLLMVLSPVCHSAVALQQTDAQHGPGDRVLSCQSQCFIVLHRFHQKYSIADGVTFLSATLQWQNSKMVHCIVVSHLLALLCCPIGVS